MGTATGITFLSYEREFARGPAPEGYDWFILPTQTKAFLAASWDQVESKALCCKRCGALVGNYTLHNEYHGDEPEEEEPKTCRHGKTEPHSHGMDEEPDYDGGPILDVLLSCWGPEDD